MRAILIVSTLFFFGLSVSGNAQNYWLGGTPGQETNWNEPGNWSKHSVPDWSDRSVVIPCTESYGNHYPEVNVAIEAIPNLVIESGAKVMVTESGNLIIDGSTTRNNGIILMGELDNNGLVEIINTAYAPIQYQQPEQIRGSGMVNLPTGVAAGH